MSGPLINMGYGVFKIPDTYCLSCDFGEVHRVNKYYMGRVPKRRFSHYQCNSSRCSARDDQVYIATPNPFLKEIEI